jgi:xylonate dehydratase
MDDHLDGDAGRHYDADAAAVRAGGHYIDHPSRSRPARGAIVPWTHHTTSIRTAQTTQRSSISRPRLPGLPASCPLTDDLLRNSPSGDLFGLSQNVGMGWAAAGSADPQFLILSTQGGVRAADGTPVALGYHTGHWEIGLLVEAAAAELRRLGKIPFAGFCSDPCDGRTQGTTGMFDSLPYRNDAALVLRRLARSLPLRAGVLGVATCDKGLPAMLMAVAGLTDLPGVIVPGGVTLPPTSGEDAGRIQTIGTRYSHGLITLEEAADLGCRACASPGGGCQFLGTAATAQVVAEALGLTLPHAALAPSGQPVWRDLAVRSAAGR